MNLHKNIQRQTCVKGEFLVKIKEMAQWPEVPPSAVSPITWNTVHTFSSGSLLFLVSVLDARFTRTEGTFPLLCSLHLQGYLLTRARSKPSGAAGKVLHTVGGSEDERSKGDGLSTWTRRHAKHAGTYLGGLECSPPGLEFDPCP